VAAAVVEIIAVATAECKENNNNNNIQYCQTRHDIGFFSFVFLVVYLYDTRANAAAAG